MRSALHYQAPLGRLLRWPLRLVPRNATVPVLTGHNRGMRWTIGAGTHGCWLGWYERATQERIAYGLRPGDVAYDIGANAGYFTLLMARLVGPTGHVHAFEPIPSTLAVLRRHLELNSITNVTVHPVAVSDRSGTLRLASETNSARAYASAEGQHTIRCVALDDLDLPLPRVVKMDIEGEESLALCGMTRILRAARPLLLIEGHIY